jgi:hypothetical protein
MLRRASRLGGQSVLNNNFGLYQVIRLYTMASRIAHSLACNAGFRGLN